MSKHPLHGAAELLRLIHNIARLGTIAAVDHGRARVRVRAGELLTAWLPWIEQRAGTTRTWNPPTEGEQVLLISPGGDPAAAVVITGLYRQTHPAPAVSGNVWHVVMPDGAVIEYDHAAQHLSANLPGSAEVTAAGGITLNADTVINGSLVINGSDVTHNGTNIGDTHKHTGVVPGGGQSGGPVQ